MSALIADCEDRAELLWRRIDHRSAPCRRAGRRERPSVYGSRPADGRRPRPAAARLAQAAYYVMLLRACGPSTAPACSVSAQRPCRRPAAYLRPLQSASPRKHRPRRTRWRCLPRRRPACYRAAVSTNGTDRLRLDRHDGSRDRCLALYLVPPCTSVEPVSSARHYDHFSPSPKWSPRSERGPHFLPLGRHATATRPESCSSHCRPSRPPRISHRRRIPLGRDTGSTSLSARDIARPTPTIPPWS